MAVYGGLVLLMRAWYGIIRTTSQLPQIPVRKLMKVAGLWMAPLIVAPPLFSRDVYSYVAQGEMMSHHISPYLYGPSVLGAPPAVNLVDPLWRNTPAPYGPLFMWIDGALTSLSLHHELIDVVLLRLLSLAGVALIAVCIPILARSMGRNAACVFTLAVLNPVTVLHLVGGAHNDGLMLGLLVAGITLSRQGRPLAGILLVLVGSGGEGARRGGHHLHRLGVDGTRDPLARPGSTTCDRRADLRRGHGRTLDRDRARAGAGSSTWRRRGRCARGWRPATGAGILLTDIAHLVGIGVPLHTMLSVTRLLGLATAAVVGVWLLIRSDRIGMLKAMGMTMLLVVALGPVVQPWYLSWGLDPARPGRNRPDPVSHHRLVGRLRLHRASRGPRPAARARHGQSPDRGAGPARCAWRILTVPLTPMDRERLLPRWRRGRRGADVGSGAPPELDLANA